MCTSLLHMQVQYVCAARLNNTCGYTLPWIMLQCCSLSVWMVYTDALASTMCSRMKKPKCKMPAEKYCSKREELDASHSSTYERAQVDSELNEARLRGYAIDGYGGSAEKEARVWFDSRFACEWKPTPSLYQLAPYPFSLAWFVPEVSRHTINSDATTLLRRKCDFAM